MVDFARSANPAVQAELSYLERLSPGIDILGLERISLLLDALGRPQDRLPPVFHVAGTNGKGSTCAFLRAGLEAAGYRVHAFTSPHLVRFNERIRIAGTLVDDTELARLLREVRQVSADIGPSFFEATTAAAFLAFSRHQADACVIEVGLGGRLDATNILARPLVCGIANIGVDHERFLGDRIEGIAAEKAGIAKLGVPLVLLAQPPSIESAISRIAAKNGAPLLLEDRDWAFDDTLQPTMAGAFQVRNANLAWAMLQAQDRFQIDRAAFDKGLARANWPARFQKMKDGLLTQGHETWIDGAHNEAAAAALASLLAERGAMQIVLGILANKDAAAIIGQLSPFARSLTFVPVPDHEHHDPERLVAEFGGIAAAGLEEALAPLPAPRLIAGSLYLAGEALARNGEVPD
ncbi:MAG: bifunctional folylpolyglutamate synthase/dihydrofolate synthase [Sphingomicrobium sp.]